MVFIVESCKKLNGGFQLKNFLALLCAFCLVMTMSVSSLGAAAQVNAAHGAVIIHNDPCPPQV